MAGTIGQQLKEARLAQGLSVEDVTHATRIPVPGVEALESDDFSVFPNGAYSRAFLSLYSRHLGVDASAALASMNGGNGSKNGGRKKRPDFLETDLELSPAEHTIPIVKHQIIERKAKRSGIGLVLYALLALMIPAVFYAGKWVGWREGLRMQAHLEAGEPEEDLPASAQGKGEVVRAQVIAPDPRERYSDRPTRVYAPDPAMNALLGLEPVPAPAPPAARAGR